MVEATVAPRNDLKLASDGKSVSHRLHKFDSVPSSSEPASCRECGVVLTNSFEPLLHRTRATVLRDFDNYGRVIRDAIVKDKQNIGDPVADCSGAKPPSHSSRPLLLGCLASRLFAP